MNGPELEQALSCALAVSDGQPVDWRRVETGAIDEAERSLLQGLRELSMVVQAYEKVRSTIGDGEEVRATDSVETPQTRGSALQTWGHLEIREPIGAGGFGEVYLAWDTRLQREVALKLVRLGREDASVVREARHLAQVRHSNVVTVFGADRHDDRVGLWMELIKGRTLQDLVDEGGPLGPREAMLIGLDLCRALAALHGAGILHRDVKARNAMRETGGRIVLMDLGAGLELTSDGSAPESGGAAGTLMYTAPEVLRGETASVQSDIYGLGVLLYYAVSTRFPTSASSMRDVEESHATARVTSISDLRPDLPESFVQVVERALAWEPTDRFPTVGHMQRALIAALGMSQPTQSSARPRTLVWATFAVAAVAIVGVLVFTRHAPRSATSGIAVEASLFRYHEGQVLGEALASRAPVREGDRLYLEVRSSEPVHLYVINVGPQGRFAALFPRDGSVPVNPLEPGPLHRLPGAAAGRSSYWVVDSASGRESFVLVAARERLGKLESALDARDQARTLGRGVKLVVEPDRSQQETRALESVLDDLRQRSASGGVWFMQIEVDHVGS